MDNNKKYKSYFKIGEYSISNHNYDLEILNIFNLKNTFNYDKNGYKIILKKLNYDKTKIEDFETFKTECINYFINKYIKYVVALSKGDHKYSYKKDTLNNIIPIIKEILIKEPINNQLKTFLELNKECKIKYITTLLSYNKKLRVVYV